jgi:NDP-sugar pyrophosphorylase family protein
VRGFILAAGFGTRLRPVTDHIPKALVLVAGKPLLERSLSFLVKQGISTIGVNSHHLHGQVEQFRETSRIPFTLFHEKEAIRGTGGGLYFAREFLVQDDLFFVCNVDIVYRFDLAPLVENFKKSGWRAGLLAVPAAGNGTIMYDPKSGLLTGVPADGKVPGRGADFIGAALYCREFLDALLPDDFSIVSVWKRVLARERGVGVMLIDKCYWRDIGTPESLAAVHFDLLDGKVDLETPATLCIDRTGKRCFPVTLPEQLRSCVGRYAWVESSDFPQGSTIAHSIVYQNAPLNNVRNIENQIVTPFCEVKFGE